MRKGNGIIGEYIGAIHTRVLKRPLVVEKERIYFDDLVKSPYAALRFILRHCDVRTSTRHSSGFARLPSGAFYFVVSIMTFYEFIKYSCICVMRIDYYTFG